MGIVVAIEAHRGRRGQAQVTLDTGQCLRLGLALVAEAGLDVGQPLSSKQAEALLAAEQVRQGLEIAYRLLGYRPRSRAEIEARLRRAALESGPISQIIQRLQEQGLLDDAAFARFWREARERGHPRGRRGLLWELERLGVAPEVAREAVADLDETTGAYRAGQRLLRHLPAHDPQVFRRRLAAGLRRRGFGVEVARSMVERLWVEASRRRPERSGERPEYSPDLEDKGTD